MSTRSNLRRAGRSAVRFLLIVLSVSAIAEGVAWGNNIYVSPSGGGAGTILSPASLQTALDMANAAAGDQVIFLQQGVYDAAAATGFKLAVVGNSAPKSITLSGGWYSSYATRSDDPETTALDGKTTTQVLNLLADGGTTPLDVHVENLTIENGYAYADSGAGIKADVSPTNGGFLNLHVKDCVIKNNATRRLPVSPYTGGHGGGIYSTCSTEVSNTAFDGNSSNYHGAAIMFTYRSPSYSASVPVKVDHSTFHDNYNIGCCPGGSAIASYVNLTVTGSDFEEQSGSGSPITTSGPAAYLYVANSSFADNHITYWGSAIQFWDTGGDVVSSAFTNNHAGWGSDGYGAITYYNPSGNPEDITVTNCTFVGNRSLSSGLGVGGALHSRGANLTMTNDILWDNGTLGLYSQYGNATISYSDVQGGLTSTGFANGGNNLDYDPQFVGGGDYQLTSNSLCVDAGDNDALTLPAKDLNGNSRVMNGHGGGDLVVDMGAYELAAFTMEPSEGTIGTRLEIAGQGYGAKKPAVYFRYESKPGVFKKAAAKIEKAADYDTAIACLWVKKMHADTYEVWVQPKIKGAAPIIIGMFTVKEPVIDAVPSSGTIKETIDVSGAFFTNKKPKVYLVNTVTLKKKSCKVTTSTMDPSTGASALQFVVPKVAAGAYSLTVVTPIGASAPETFEVMTP